MVGSGGRDRCPLRVGGAVSGEQNGRVKLSWGQIVWAVGVIAAILGSWYDVRTQQEITRQALALHVQWEEREIARIWKAVEAAQAAPAPATARGKGRQ